MVFIVVEMQRLREFHTSEKKRRETNEVHLHCGVARPTLFRTH